MPGSPTGIGAAAGDRYVRVSWHAPASNGGSAITSYVIQRTSNGVYRDVARVGTAVRSWNSTGLTNGTRYWFRVIAVNAAGRSVPSLPASAVPRTVPGSPTGIGAAAGDRYVRVSWHAPASTGGAAITSYVIQRTSDGVYHDVASGGFDGAGLEQHRLDQRHPLLVPGHRGQRRRSQRAERARQRRAPHRARQPDRDRRGRGRTGTSESVGTPRRAPAVRPITSYVIQRTSNGVYRDVGRVGTTVRAWNSTGLTNGTRYWFRVIAVNAAGRSVPSLLASAVPVPVPVPGSPTGIGAAAGDRYVRVSWHAPASNGGAAITSYVIQRTSDGVYRDVGVVGSTVRAWNSTGLTNGTRYWFRVIAVNAAGRSVPSVLASAVPNGAPRTQCLLRCGAHAGWLRRPWRVLPGAGQYRSRSVGGSDDRVHRSVHDHGGEHGDRFEGDPL